MELLLVHEANEDTDSPAETHLTKKRIASEEFLHKYRKGIPLWQRLKGVFVAEDA